MEEEEEICRVCRSEGTPEQPLFHPCKCAGSIRHVHQECLIEWLAHSRKKYCELCEHPFSFTPVYRQDMPVVLPPKLFVLQLRKKLAFAIITTLRAILVSCIWLIVLPYFTIWVWRLYFFLGANLSKHLSRLQQMKHHYGISSGIAKSNLSITLLPSSSNETAVTTLNWLQDYKSRLTLQTFLSDCFEGQIITCVVVVIFVAVFLLREWIVQNIPMDAPIIEEEEEEDLAVDNPMVDVLENQQPQDFQDEFPRDLRFQQDTSLFDMEWDQQQPERPPSPIAINNEIWLGNGAASTSDNVFINHSSNDHTKPTRATSMPPSFSTSSSFHDDADEGFNNINDYIADRRSASMEPFIDTTVTNTGSRLQEDMPPSPTRIHRGHPPHAPRMRHAEAPVPIIRPIPEEEEEEERVPPPVIAHQLHHRQHAPPPAAVAANNEEEEDEENIEEFEGVLEAIGMQGSLWSLVQNCALMGLLIGLSLGAAVALPYLIGMLFIMTETFDLIRIPLKLARLVTDPLVDLIFWLCQDYIGPWIVAVYQTHVQSLISSFTALPIMNGISSAFTYIFNYIMNHGLLLADSSSSIISDNNIPTATMNETTSTSLIGAMAKFINETEPIVESALERYQSFATGQTPMDRFVCISVGYIIVTIVSCWYLSRSAQNNMATAAFGRTAQEALRHQGIIFKVGMFITIELILFPIVCGFLLDLSTMPLFKGANFLGRWMYLKQHPVPSIFVHWFLGTGFMFLFAVLVTLCRDIVRPGVMWFIRDPNDLQFHPIREIVERPILSQFKKIGASALIYLTVILVGIGGVVHAINTLAGHILPLRWSLSNPLSVIPIDLIVIQVGIPALVKYFQPKQTIKALFVAAITWTCRQLRLTSFMFGGRKPEEEGTLVYHTWLAWIKRSGPSHYPPEGSVEEDIIGPEVSYFWDGQLMRVPRHDSVPIIDRRRMLVPVDSMTLEPIDERERLLGHPASSAPGGNEANTIVVYSPPRFKQRVITFLGFMWFSISVFCCAVTIIPVVLGRALFKEGFGVENDVHDIYSFVLGGSILLLTTALVNQNYKTVKDIKSQATWQDVTACIWRHTKQWNLWIFNWIFFLTCFGVIVPMILGTMIELYFVLPMRKLDDVAPSVEVMTLWAHGFASMVILHGCIQVAPDNSFRELLAEIFRGGIHEMDIRKCSTKIMIPLAIVSAFAILLPFNVVYLNMKLIAPNNPEMRTKLMQIVYPLALSSIGAYLLVRIGSRMGTRLVQNIREDNYLVGRTLHNLEQ